MSDGRIIAGLFLVFLCGVSCGALIVDWRWRRAVRKMTGEFASIKEAVEARATLALTRAILDEVAFKVERELSADAFSLGNKILNMNPQEIAAAAAASLGAKTAAPAPPPPQSEISFRKG
jgi:hypothetical protein